jgi:hypothetical protein
MDPASNELHPYAARLPGWEHEANRNDTLSNFHESIPKDSLSPEGPREILRQPVELNWQPPCSNGFTADQDYLYPEFRHYIPPQPLRHEPSFPEEQNRQTLRSQLSRLRAPRPRESISRYQPQPDRYPPCHTHWVRCPTPTEEEKAMYEQQWQDSEAKREKRGNRLSPALAVSTTESKITSDSSNGNKSKNKKAVISKRKEDNGTESEDDIDTRLVHAAAKVAEEAAAEIARLECES